MNEGRNPSQLTKACICSFECDEQDIPNDQEKKSALLAKYAEYYSIFMPTFNLNANKYGNAIQEIIDEGKDLDLIEEAKKTKVHLWYQHQWL